jgi:predicted CXXCH cytochrome family protein
MPTNYLAAVLLALFLAIGPRQAAATEAQGFAGSASCAECHESETAAWRSSHHGWALREAGPESVLADFNDKTFSNKGVVSRFFRDGAKYMVETDGPDGKPRTYAVKYTIGVTPLQQYLVETDKGRLQVLDLAWDTAAKTWFHLYPDSDVGHGNGMHWTGSYKNWQARCADCHQTGFDKGFDAATDSYRSHWQELTVSCESCHGPSAAHVAWAKQTPRSSPVPPMISLGPGQQANELAVCGPCHSRREAFSQTSAPIGSWFGDHYNLSLLTPDLYFGDGQQNAEVFILGSFLQSKMKARGVTCSNCHEPHSAGLVAEGNAVCTQCHNPAGNAGFPTLSRKDYDTEQHTHHKAGSEAALCVSCHMPSRNYMVIDGRRDHFFRIPDPLQSQAAGAPDACTGCHDKETPEWAAAKIAAWFPVAHRSWQDRGAFIAFNRGERTQQVFDALATYAFDLEHPDVVRATAVANLREGTGPEVNERLKSLLGDKSELVRAAAPALFRRIDPTERAALLTPLLSDPSRAVRQAAAVELAGGNLTALDPPAQKALAAALAEYLESRKANADMPEAHMALGGLALSMRKWDEAEAAFSESARIDPQLEQAWVTLARLRAALGDDQTAEQYLQRGLQYLPKGVDLLFERAALEQRRGNDARAVDWYRRITAIDPKLVDAWLGLGAAALRSSQPALAVDAASRAVALNPALADAHVIAAFGSYAQGDVGKAKAEALRARELVPGIELPPELEALLKP